MAMPGAGGAGGAPDVGQIIGDRLLTALEAAEEQLDQQIDRLDKMDEDEIERLRRARVEQLKQHAKQKSQWMAQGHGEYREVQDQKRFFEELRTTPRAVVHFYRSTTRRCEIIDKHLHVLARKHIETKFLRVDAEKSPFLSERLKIWMLPTMVLIKEGKTDHSIVGFDELGGNDSFPTEALEKLLLGYGMVLEAYCS